MRALIDRLGEGTMAAAVATVPGPFAIQSTQSSALLGFDGRPKWWFGGRPKKKRKVRPTNSRVASGSKAGDVVKGKY